MSRNLPKIILVLTSIFSLLLLAGCEPNEWYRILAAPPPVAGLSWSNHTGNDITFDFTLPDLSEELAFFPNYSFDVDYYYRLAAGSQEIYLGRFQYDDSDSGAAQTETVTLSLAADSYVFILYTVDTEYQKSTPAETTTVAW
jgi:hypothetical protein